MNRKAVVIACVASAAALAIRGDPVDGAPAAGDGKKARQGRTFRTEKREPHPATVAKTKSDSLKRLLGKKRRKG